VALATLTPLAVTALRITLATPLLIALNPASVLTAPVLAGEIAPLLSLALIPGLAALLAYYHGLRNARASRAAIAELSFPVTGAILNWVLLGAHISGAQVAGFALLWAAILNLNRGGEKANPTLA
jgi:drug/metabolite transporter (DMT)-like permease